MRICYTALFSHYEELKPPLVITPGWHYVAYTDQPIKSAIWEIRHVELNGFAPQLLARWYKIMEWVDWKESLWVDASFQINTDLNLWWEKYFKGGLCAAAHPLRNCVYAECLDCIIAQRGDKLQVQNQMAEYKALNIPANNGIIQSGILLRENTPEVIALCERWYEELRTRSIRDQIAFAKVSMGCDFVHQYQWDYRQGKDFVYHHHYNRRGGAHIKMSV